MGTGIHPHDEFRSARADDPLTAAILATLDEAASILQGEALRKVLTGVAATALALLVEAEADTPLPPTGDRRADGYLRRVRSTLRAAAALDDGHTLIGRVLAHSEEISISLTRSMGETARPR